MTGGPAAGEGAAPLTVLIFNPMGGDGWGGVERWFLDLARGLRARGHRVLSVGKPGSLWTRRTLAEGFPTRSTDMAADFAVGEARAIAHWIQEERVEVVLTKLHRGIRLGGLAARFAGHVPVVAFMGLVEIRPGWRHRLTHRLFLRGIVTLAESMRAAILRVGRFRPEFVAAIPYGVVPGEYVAAPGLREEVRREFGVAPGEPLLLAAGRLHDQKRFDLLLEAFGSFRREHPRTRLVIAGTGSLLDDLRAKARAAGVEERTTFAGFRPDVPRLMAGADLFVMSSDDEGLPMVVLEAMASGLCVAVTDVGAMRELVVDGETGRVVPRRDPEALAAAVRGLLDDDTLRRRMGEAGRARVRERFPLDLCVRRTEEHLLWIRDGGP